MRSGRWDIITFRVSLILAGISLIFVTVLLVWHIFDQSQVVDGAKGAARKTAIEAADQIEAFIVDIPGIAQTLADDLTSGKQASETLEDRLKIDLLAHPKISAITACYTPEFASEFSTQFQQNLYCPYSWLDDDKVPVIIRVDDYYNYTQPDGTIGPDGPIRTIWYHLPLEEGEGWGEPYKGTANYWSGYAAPFFYINPTTQEQTVAGIIAAELTLDDLQTLVASTIGGDYGARYGFIISQAGKFISHPISSFVADNKNIHDFDDSLSIETLQATVDSTSKEIIVVDHVDNRSGQQSWVFLAPLETNKWWVGIVLNKGEVFRSGGTVGRLRRQRIGLAIGLIAFLSFLSVPIYRAHRGGFLNLWAVSITVSALCIAGITYMWVLNSTSLSRADESNILLLDQATLEQTVADLSGDVSEPVTIKADEFLKPTLITIPTGVFIRSMRFEGARNIVVTGQIWQKYSDGLPDWVKPAPGDGLPGFDLPQADSTYSEDVKELYRRIDGDQEIIGWSFRANLRQDFDFSRFPFDREEARIRILHKNFDQGVLLIPDLVSYSTTDPTALPGLDQDNIVLPGWEVEESFFSLRVTTYNTNFGIQSRSRLQKFPELYFNISLSRRILDPFISRMIPLALVALLLFAVLIIVTSRRERIGLLGFSTSTVLSYCAALLFVVVISQISLRSDLTAQGLLYMEFFYFVIYGAILSVSLNSILFATFPNLRFIQYRDNLVMVLLFWPMLFGLILIVTLLTFS